MIMMLSFNGSLQPSTFGAGATSPRTTYRWAAVPFEHGEDAFNEEEGRTRSNGSSYGYRYGFEAGCDGLVLDGVSSIFYCF